MFFVMFHSTLIYTKLLTIPEFWYDGRQDSLLRDVWQTEAREKETELACDYVSKLARDAHNIWKE